MAKQTSLSAFFAVSSGSDRSTASTSTTTTTNRLCSSSGEPSTDSSSDEVDSFNDNLPEQLETRRHSLLERTIENFRFRKASLAYYSSSRLPVGHSILSRK